MNILKTGVVCFIFCYAGVIHASESPSSTSSGAGLRSDGELVQAGSASTYPNLTMKRGVPAGKVTKVIQPTSEDDAAYRPTLSDLYIKSYSTSGDADDKPSPQPSPNELKQP